MVQFFAGVVIEVELEGHTTYFVVTGRDPIEKRTGAFHAGLLDGNGGRGLLFIVIMDHSLIPYVKRTSKKMGFLRHDFDMINIPQQEEFAGISIW